MSLQDPIGPRVAIVPCTSRKSLPSGDGARAHCLPRTAQRDLETAWLQRAAALRPSIKCADLYAGRGMALAREAAAAASADLFVASAGLGLVDAKRTIASYGVTVGARGDDSIAARSVGRFDAGAWWRAVQRGPFATPLPSVIASTGGGPVLIALSQPYAAMLASDLSAIPQGDRGGLRLLGWRLDRVLDASLHRFVMPYDARLDTVIPGTRCDFPQRALLHFARLMNVRPRTVLEDATAVRDSLAEATAPARPARTVVTDDAVLAWLSVRCGASGGIGRMLKALRDEGFACEQRRFSRLYRRVVSTASAS